MVFYSENKFDCALISLRPRLVEVVSLVFIPDYRTGSASQLWAGRSTWQNSATVMNGFVRQLVWWAMRQRVCIYDWVSIYKSARVSSFPRCPSAIVAAHCAQNPAAPRRRHQLVTALTYAGAMDLQGDPAWIQISILVCPCCCRWAAITALRHGTLENKPWNRTNFFASVPSVILAIVSMDFQAL